MTVLFLALALPVTLYLAQQVQDLRQRASGLPVTSATPPEPPAINSKILFKTQDVYLKADNFFIQVGGKKFTALNSSGLKIRSIPATNITTLEADWAENSTKMKLYITFKVISGQWTVSEIRTLDGTGQAGWVYYDPIGINHTLGYEFVNAYLEKPSVRSDNNVQGIIRFENLHLEPFLTLSRTYPTPNFSSTVVQGRYLNLYNSVFTHPDLQIELKNGLLGITQVSTDPNWFFDSLPSGSYRLSAANIPGYTASYSLCTSQGCNPANVFTAGNIVYMSLTENNSVTVHTKYVPSTSVSPTPKIPSPSPSTVKISPTPTGTISGDPIDPTIRIVSPRNNIKVRRRAIVPVIAHAKDNVKVKQVEITVNGKKICTDVRVPYTCNWFVPNTKRTQYTITATATDTSGNQASNSVTVISN